MARLSWTQRVATMLAMLLAVSACQGSSNRVVGHETTTTAVPDDYCAGTSYGSQVVVYSAKGLEYWYNDLLTTFQANCGVRVVFQSGPSGAMEARLKEEAKHPFADIFIAAAPDMAAADASHLLESDGTPGSAGVPDDRCGPGRHWCDVLENFVSFVYNPKLVKNPPRTWNDLLAPRFAGQLLLSRPDQTADGLSLLVLLDQTFGRAAALRYLAKLERSVKSHWNTTDTMSRLVASGFALVANGDLSEDLNDITQYHNIAIWFPSKDSRPTTLEVPFGAALVRGGHNRVNADALLRFMWSKDGQRGVADASALPARTDVVPDDCRSRDLRKRLSGVRILRPDWTQVARDQRVLAAAWRRIKRAPDGVPPPPASIPPLQPC